jgi:hypothetical protein
MEPKTVLLDGGGKPMKKRLEKMDFAELKLARQTGSTASKGELQGFLSGYLGDEVFATRFADCIDMIRAKNADYSQGEQKGDRIAAFRRIGRDIGLPMTKVWAVFAQKHWGAIMRFIKDGRLESEPVGGRINDTINYMVIFGAIVDELGPQPGDGPKVWAEDEK